MRTIYVVEGSISKSMYGDMRALSDRVHELERQCMEISHPWFQFESADETDVKQLQDLVSESKASLSQLSNALDERLNEEVDPNRRDRFQHAFNLVQELLTSRSAVYDTLVLSEINPHLEYFRAVAIKEKAAYDQTRKLIEVMRGVQ
jgi:hypothetical protein